MWNSPHAKIEPRPSSEVDSVAVDQISSKGDSLPPTKLSVIVRPLVSPPGSPHGISKTCGEQSGLSGITDTEHETDKVV